MSPDQLQTYWESRLDERFSLEGVGFLGLGRSFNIWMYRARRSLFLRHVRPHLGATDRFGALDIGSGTGFYIELWEELKAASIVGSDITAVAVERLAQRYPDHEFVQMDIGAEEQPLRGRQFDAVSACDVLFHIIDDERYRRAFANVFQLVRPGGLFVFTDNFLHGSTVRAPTQVSRSLAESEAAVRDAGFEIVSRRPALVLMSAPIDSTSRLHRSFWRGLARAASATEATGWLAGAALYPIDLLLGGLVREGPTTELMICRRP